VLNVSSRRPAGLALAIAAMVASPMMWGGIARAASLPDGRGYELVSPPLKNGGDVMADSARTRAAEVEEPGLPMAVSYSSLTGFGDVHGTGIATDYLSVRDARPGTNGWSTHGITPVQDALSYFAAVRSQDPVYEGDFSANLSSGVFRAWSVLAPAPNVEEFENLYVRKDLRTPGAGSYQLATDSTVPLSAYPAFFLSLPQFFLLAPRYVGASADFSHVLFESQYDLTSDASGLGPKLYESVNGAVRLAGILPDGSPLAVSVAGRGADALYGPNYTPHVISNDGRRIFFTVPESVCTGGACGELYMRVEGTTTVQLNASERSTPDPNGSQPATYWNASVDGSRVFFTSPEALTDDAPLNGDSKLYMYDTTKPDTDPHNLTLLSVDRASAISNDVQGVSALSDDGRYVYFVTTGQIVAGQPTFGERGIFAWHDDGSPNGSVAFVGAIPSEDVVGIDIPTNPNLRPFTSRATPDGRYFLFTASSGAGLTGYDHGHCAENGSASGQCYEAYIYDATTAHLHCASCRPDNAPASADVQIRIRAGTSAASTTTHLNRALTDGPSGARVFFSTREALVPSDVNGKVDAYEYELPNDGSPPSVHLISSGTSSSDAYFLDASPDGKDAFFLTRDRLVGWDTDDSYDLYDARIGGGFPEPVAPAPQCSADACRGSLQSGLATPSLGGTALFHGSGNVRATARKHKIAKRCKRGYVRKRVRGKVRCVRKRHVKKAVRASRERSGR
jgi:hypothetical protein